MLVKMWLFLAQIDYKQNRHQIMVIHFAADSQRGRHQETKPLGVVVTEDTGAISRSSGGGTRRRTSRHNSIGSTVDHQRSLAPTVSV